MTRAQQQISIGLLITAVYLACLVGLVPIFPDVIQDEIIPVLPLWAIVSFGAYLLSRVGIALLFFNDVPEAHKSLMEEIELAKVDLKAKGVDID